MSARHRLDDTTLAKAEALKEAGFTEAYAGRPATARRSFKRAQELLSTVLDQRRADELTVRVLLGLSSTESDLYGLDRGLAVLDEARRYVQAGPARPLLALVHAQTGMLLLRGGQTDAAIENLDTAVERIAELDVVNQASLLLNRGTALLDLDRPGPARADFSRCVALPDLPAHPDLMFKARCNLGWTQFLAGDLPHALRALADAAGMDVDVERGILTMDRARVLTEAGLVREADEQLARAEADFTRLRLSQDRAEAELARAECALLAGEPERAERFARRAARRFDRRGSARWAEQARLRALHARAARSRGRRSVDQALALQASLTAHGRTADAASAALLAAELMVEQGSVDEAGGLIGPADPGERIGLRTQRRLVAAKTALAQRQPSRARRELGAGLADIASHQARFGGLDLRTAAAVHGVRLSQLHLDVAVHDGRPAVVFDAAEDVRAISSRLPFVRASADPHTAQLLSQLRIVSEGIRGSGGDGTPEQLGRRRDLEAQIAARGWEQPGHLGATGRPVRYRSARAALADAGTDLVAYLRTGSRLVAVVVGVGRGRVVELGNAQDVRELVRRIRADLDLIARSGLPGGIRAGATAALREGLATLDRRIVVPLAIGTRPLTVVSGGAASLVPWAIMPSLRGVAVSVTPSATSWVNAPSALPGAAQVAALAGPGLHRAAEEANMVSARWRGGRATTAATTTQLLDALRSADLVHIAAHGRHESQNPMFSSIRMIDGALFAHEIPPLARVPRHVVLSACDLGMATIRPGDEPLGLTSVLLHAGVRSVVASVARVADDVAADVMTGYHRCLQAGQDPAAALATVTAELDRPAPFVCFGRS